MDIAPATDSSFDYDVIVVAVASDLELQGRTADLNSATDNAIGRLIECGEINGKEAEVTVILSPAGLSTTHLVVVGTGDAIDVRSAFRAAAAGMKAVTSKSRARVLMAFGSEWDEACQEAAVAGGVVGTSGPDLYRAEKKRIEPEAVFWSGISPEVCHRGQDIGESVNLTRRLVNMPAGHLYPESFAEEALKVADENGLGIEIWDEAQLREQRCGSLLAVSQGSARPARLVMVRHRGGKSDSLPLALVGKGVTFDSGGLSIKPSDGMKTMKCDMAGAATVLGTMQAIARLNLPINVVGVMGLVENMIGPDSYKLGDVLTSRSGKTIEVLNTDAEGRLVLADALNVTVEMKPERIIDLATLTGACVVALGLDVVGAMTNNEALCNQVLEASKQSGEDVWELPMFPEFSKQLRSEIADVKNIGDGRWGGAITAAKFLEEFISDVPWVHLDIAGPAFLDKPKPWLDVGGSGVMVRSLLELVRRLA